jgi:hypothetical protein
MSHDYTIHHCLPHSVYTLWLFNIAMENGPFIDALPINSMVIFHGYVSHNQMVYILSIYITCIPQFFPGIDPRVAWASRRARLNIVDDVVVDV